MVRWQKASGGNFDVHIRDLNADKITSHVILRRELDAVDARIADVLDSLIYKKFDNIEVQNVLAYTYQSLWAKANKIYKPTKTDGLYRALLPEDNQDSWYIEKFVRVIPDVHLSNWMRVVVNVYATATTPTGTAYVNDIQTTQLSRSTDWLDEYIENGATYLQLLRDLDTPEDELAGKLQEQYLGGCHKNEPKKYLVAIPADLTP